MTVVWYGTGPTFDLPFFILQFIVQILCNSFCVLLGGPKCFVNPLVHKAHSLTCIYIQSYSNRHNKSWDRSAWRLQRLSEDRKGSIKMVVISWSRKFSITLGKQSSVVLSANIKLNISLISEGSHRFHLLVLQSCPILASPLSCVLLWLVAFHGSQLKPADTWASRKHHVSASGEGFSILSEAVHLIQSVRPQGQRSQGKDPHWLQLGLDPICHLHFTASGDFAYQLIQRESTPK